MSSFLRKLSHSSPSSNPNNASKLASSDDHKRIPDSKPLVERYSDLLDWRISNPKATQEIRDQAASEKRAFDKMTGEEKERWAMLRAWKDTDATAGVIGSGAAPPGMVWQ